jgi:hypothetical protein
MEADLTITVGTTQIPVYLGENTLLAAREADRAELAQDAAETAAASLGADADLGDMATKPAFGAVGPVWRSRPTLSDQPTAAVDMTSGANFQVQNGLTSPGIRLTATPGVNGLQLECLYGGVIGMIAPTALVGRGGMAYAGRGTVTAVGGSNAGIIVALTPVAPTLGGEVSQTDAGACLICIRQNGTVTVTQRDAFTAFVGASISNGSINTFNEGEEIEWLLQYSGADDTEAVLKLIVDGVAQADRTITGLPATSYIGGGIRSAEAGTIGFVTEVAAFGPSLDVVRRVFLTEGAAAGGDGSADAPFNSVELVRRAILRDFARKQWRLTVRGEFEDAEIAFDGSIVRKVTIEGADRRAVDADRRERGVARDAPRIPGQLVLRRGDGRDRRG